MKELDNYYQVIIYDQEAKELVDYQMHGGELFVWPNEDDLIFQSIEEFVDYLAKHSNMRCKSFNAEISFRESGINASLDSKDSNIHYEHDDFVPKPSYEEEILFIKFVELVAKKLHLQVKEPVRFSCGITLDSDATFLTGLTKI